MESWIDTGRGGIPRPRFCIGDAVVYQVDEPNTSGCIHFDDGNPTAFICWWYRGIITGCRWSCGESGNDDWRDQGWIYRVRFTESWDQDWLLNRQISPFEEWPENELKASTATLKRCEWADAFSEALQAAVKPLRLPSMNNPLLPPCVHPSRRVLGAVKGAAKRRA